MARIVLHEEQGPIEVKVGNESKWICQCGLSKNKLYCDGSHNKTKDEEKGKVYKYNPNGTRKLVQ
ncbi:MAG: CDGSH iron-sulfur domain-containing protein [Nanoarchaeota archaeon]